jgi:hypothetical protein
MPGGLTEDLLRGPAKTPLEMPIPSSLFELKIHLSEQLFAAFRQIIGGMTMR